jgi:hypothetical protein
MLSSLESENVLILDLNSVVCQNNEFPCKDFFEKNEGRKDGIHYSP